MAEAERRFCCPACELVFQAIHEAGLGTYYRRREQAPGRPAEEPPPGQFAWLDRLEIGERYLAQRPDGTLEASLVLEGLHCAACAWLVERAVGDLEGVEEARVNYATSRLQVRWTREACGLGQVARQVSRVGYRAVPYDPAGQEAARSRDDRDLLLRMGVAGAAAGNTMLLAVALYAGASSDLEEPYRTAFHAVSLALSLPVLFYSATPFFRGAWTGLRHGAFTMDVPIALGILVTFLYSLWATLAGQGEVYFDTMANFVFVLLVGRMLERSARGRVSNAVERLLALRPRSAVRVRAGERQEVSVEELIPGDLVEVVPGCAVPVDGRVREGTAWVDESALTGESAPASRGPGDLVAAGVVNRDGVLLVEALRTGNDTALAQIARRIEEAQVRQAPVQRLADRAARWFVGIVLWLAAGTFVLWLPSGAERAMVVAVAVLIITCPCALALATPLAVSVATGRAASRGILFRGGDVLEAARGLTHVILDKTGTATEGVFELRSVLGDPAGLRVAAALEQRSVHPLARALVGAGLESPPEALDFRAVPGRGVSGRVEGASWALGNLDFLEGAQVEPALRAQAEVAEGQGHTVIWLAREGRVVSAFALADRLRPEAPEVVGWLRSRGLEVLLVSGDRPAPVQAAARALGVEEFHAGVLPQAKEELVRRLQSGGARVAMVGDGVNDAAALAAAEVGIAMARGSDISMEAADVVLLRPGLAPVVETLEIARLALATIQDNLRLSVIYNALAIPAAVSGWVAPLVAAVAMPISSLLVVGNSLRLARRRIEGTPESTEEPVALVPAGGR